MEAKIASILNQWYSELPPVEIQRRVAEAKTHDITLLQIQSPCGFEEAAFYDINLRGQSFQQYCRQSLSTETDLDVFYAPISGRLYIQRGWPRYCDGCRGVLLFSGTCIVTMCIVIVIVLLVPRQLL